MTCDEMIHLAKKQEPYVIAIRRRLHEDPELSSREVNTAALVEREARFLGLEVESVPGTGRIAVLESGRPGNVVALRADMDALPVQENPENLKFPRKVMSKNPGVSHACGHDAHVAMLLGAMRLLCELRESLTGTVLFCFEEGEETAAGWQAMLNALEKWKVDTAFALHVSSALGSGLVSMEPGPRMGGMVGVDVTFVGRGGHGSRPDLSVNPVFAAAAALTNLSVAFANQINANETVTLGITSIQGGSVYNVIPDTATVLGTLRFFNRQEGEKALGIVRNVFQHTAQMHGCTLRCNPATRIIAGPTVNDADAAALARRAFEQALPEGSLVKADKWFGSESFAYYTERYKSAFAFLGVRNEALGCGAEHHNERFDLDEGALYKGVICHAAYALAALEAQW